MAASKSSKNSRRSEAQRALSRAAIQPGISRFWRRGRDPFCACSLGDGAAVALCFFATAAVMAGAIAYFYRTGRTLQFGDAEAHLDIARRIVESRTPGWSQIGTTWLPLPHLLMIPLVRNDWMWTTGLAGAIASGACMTLAVSFLFAAVRRILRSISAAAAAAAVFLLNPNTLYFGSIPMTEPAFFAALFALLYFTVRFRETRGWGALSGAALAAFAGTLTRYEAWPLVPFAAVYIAIHGDKKRWAAALLFCAIACAGPLLWLAHNRWYFGDPLYFYRGPYSALVIQGKSTYPGKGDWRVAAQYFLAAGRAVAGWPALAIGAAGIVAALIRRIVWPILFLALPPAFYIWSIHSSGTPVYVPTLWPNSWYNTRYALAFLPLVALGTAALGQFGSAKAAGRGAKQTRNSSSAAASGVSVLREFPGVPVAVALVAIALAHFSIPITWQESDVNSRARLQWIAQAAEILRSSAGPHETFFTSFGDLTAIFRSLGIPLADTLTGDNDVEWAAAVARPDLFLHTDWAVVTGGDEPQSVIDKARLHGPRYELAHRVIVKGEPVMEIYRRTYENPVR